MQQPAFRRYARLVTVNASSLAASLSKMGWRVVSGGTDTHLFLIDVWQGGKGLTGREAQDRLEAVGIIANRNAIPYDARSPFNPSGLRMGTPLLAMRAMRAREMREVAELIHAALLQTRPRREIARAVKTLCRRFPLPM